MKLCIVGLGPSAKGRGREIDACDFVVRMKAFWRCGAEDAGTKINAWAYYGYTGSSGDGVPKEDIVHHVPRGTEHWFTHCRQQVQEHAATHQERLDNARLAAGGDPFHQLPGYLWLRAKRHLNRDPSTGFVAVCMALEYFTAELVLYGFDSTTTDKPNYWDARGGVTEAELDNLPHHMDVEKRAIAEILGGKWLAQGTGATLTWPDMPELG